MPFEASFDATQFEPSQSVGAHPAGKFPATISNTLIKPTKAGDGGLFEVEFTTPAGRITTRYNLWNNSPKAVEIAHKELSALCHATGIFKLDFRNDAMVLRNARCMIDVDKQDNSDYMEVKKVYDVNGNEPGRAPASAPQPQQQSGGWGANVQAAPQGTQPAPQANGGWGNAAQQAPPQQQQPAPQPVANPASGGWQPGPSTGAPAPTQPPWANRG